MYRVHTEIKFTLKSKTIMATETNNKKKNFPAELNEEEGPTQRSDEHWPHTHWLFYLLLRTETVCTYFKAGNGEVSGVLSLATEIPAPLLSLKPRHSHS